MSEKHFTATLGVCAAAFALAVSSASATPTLSLATGPDPAESITTQIVAAGSASAESSTLHVTVKPSGGQGCGANPSADQGESLYFGGYFKQGPFSQSENYTFRAAGSYLVCGWLTGSSEGSEPALTAASLTVAVRPPHLALSITAPTAVRPRQTFQVVTTAQAEVSREVQEFILPYTTRGCPANSEAARSTSGELGVYWPSQHDSSWNVDGGPFSESVNESFNSAGRYLICAYVEYPSTESPPETTANAIVTAAVPRPHCVVPQVRAGSTLSSAEASIRRAHCAVGHVHSTPSRRFRKGRVLHLGAAAGRVLAFHTAVSVFVSSGARH